MSDMPAVQQPGTKGIAQFFAQENVANKFKELMGDRGKVFITSILTAVNQNDMLKNADATSVYMGALVAASLDLPINPSLGFAYLVPYNTKNADNTYTVKAQFQLGAKGFKQLALRSGQFKLMSDAIVYEGQLVEENPLTGFVFDWTAKKSDKVIGYVSYFQLLNGFESTFYMSKERVEAHGKKYSKTFTFGTWKSDFDAMGLKTVVKLNLSKNAPLSVEMQKAQIADQAIIRDADTLDVAYEDAIKPIETISTIEESVLEDWRIQIGDCSTLDMLTNLRKNSGEKRPQIMAMFMEKEKQLKDVK